MDPDHPREPVAPPESDAGEEDPGASLGELPTARAMRGEQRAHERAHPSPASEVDLEPDAEEPPERA